MLASTVDNVASDVNKVNTAVSNVVSRMDRFENELAALNASVFAHVS